MAQTVIKIENVKKAFRDVRAVGGLSFGVDEASCFGLLGPNGAGKTTMMKMIYGRSRRDDPDASVIDVFGYDPKTNELDIKYLAGVVPQENNLDDELNVRENLMVYAKFYDINGREAKKRIDELLEFLELSDKAGSIIRELSGGMKRRLIIARALLNNPKLLILDEPTTGLDPQVRHLIWGKLRQLKKSGITILLTTHYMEEAFEICDKILIMHKGSKILEGAPKELLERHIEKYVLAVSGREDGYNLRHEAQNRNIRIDDSHEVIFFYSHQLGALEELAKTLSSSQYYLRQSNLEDLFLKTTGRGLSSVE